MNEMQMLFLFCVFYSGAFSIVIWAKIRAQMRAAEAHPKDSGFSGKWDRGA